MSGLGRRCTAGRPAGVGQHLTVVESAPARWTTDAPHWRAEVVLLSSPSRCMVSGRRCYPLALRLTNVLDPIGRSIILDLASVAALIDSGMTVLEAGAAEVEGDSSDDCDDD